MVCMFEWCDRLPQRAKRRLQMSSASRKPTRDTTRSPPLHPLLAYKKKTEIKHFEAQSNGQYTMHTCALGRIKEEDNSTVPLFYALHSLARGTLTYLANQRDKEFLKRQWGG